MACEAVEQRVNLALAVEFNHAPGADVLVPSGNRISQLLTLHGCYFFMNRRKARRGRDGLGFGTAVVFLDLTALERNEVLWERDFHTGGLAVKSMLEDAPAELFVGSRMPEPLRANDQYRITFRREGHDAFDVRCEDYH